MSAKQRHKQRVKQRLREKLTGLETQEEALYSIIKDYVAKVKVKTREVLVLEDTSQFLAQYPEVDQMLDRAYNTCELLTATAEDMFDGSQDEEEEAADLSAPLLESTALEDWSDNGRPPHATSTPETTPDSEQKFDSKAEPVLRESKSRSCKHPTRTVECASEADKAETNSFQIPPSKNTKHPKVQKEVIKEKFFKSLLTSPEQKKDKVSKAGAAVKEQKRAKVGKAGAAIKGVPSPVKKRLNKTFDESTNVQACGQEQKLMSNDRPTGVPHKTDNSSKMKDLQSSREEKNEQTITKSSEQVVAGHGARCNVTAAQGQGVATSVKVKSTMLTGATSYDSESTGVGCQATDVSSQETGMSSQATGGVHQSAGSCVKTEGECVLTHGALLANKPTPVIVTEIISPFCFFVQKNGPSLGCLMEGICEYISRTGGDADAVLKNPAVGMVCLACYSKDRAFYRAHITGIHKLGTDNCIVDVLYVDYGNKERVRASQLRRLPKQFTSLPTQAICCALAQVMPCNKYRVWTEEDIFTFKQYVFNQQLTCIPVCHSSDPRLPYLIKLVTSIPMPAMVCATSISIGQILVSRGSAKYVDVMDQVNLLAKSPEGVEEVLILNGEGRAGSGTGVEIRELNDSSFLADSDTKSSGTELVGAVVHGDSECSDPVANTGSVGKGVVHVAGRFRDSVSSTVPVAPVTGGFGDSVTSTTPVVPVLNLESQSVEIPAEVNIGQTKFSRQTTSVGKDCVKDESDEKLVSPRSECSDTESQLGDMRHDAKSNSSVPWVVHSSEARHRSSDTQKIKPFGEGRANRFNDGKKTNQTVTGDVRTSKSNIEEKPESGDGRKWRTGNAGKHQSSDFRQPNSSHTRKFPSSDRRKAMQSGNRVTDNTKATPTGIEDQKIGVPVLPEIQEESDSGWSSNENKEEQMPIATEVGVSTDPTQSECDSEQEPDPAGQKVMMAHAVSPSQFYVHLVSLEVGHTLDNMMRKLGDHYENMSADSRAQLSDTVVPPSVGQLYCAQFTKDNCFYRYKFTKDNCFYRARVTEISTDETGESGNLHVSYVDYGDEEWIECIQLLPLPEEFADVPPQAIHCALAYVRPFGWERGQDWSSSCKDVFKDATGGGDNEKTLLMYVVQGNFSTNENGEAVVEEGVRLEVLLVDSTGPEDQWECINKKLVSLGEAELVSASDNIENTGGTSEGEEPLEWDPMAVDYYSKRNSYNIDVDDAGVATTGHKANDESQICRFFSRGLNCWRGDRCAFRHVFTDSGTTLEREEVYAVSNNQEEMLPALHSWVAIEIATILSPSHFYALLPHGKKSLDGASSEVDLNEGVYPPGESADHPETLESMLEALQLEYEKRPFHERKHIQVLKAPGEVVAACFSQDQQWYRARIIEVTESKIKVFYLDYGNTEWLVDDDIADIEPQFLHLPFQAVECFLFQVETKDPDQPWSAEARTCFRELVDGKVLVGCVRSRSCNGCLCVELFDTSGSDDVNVGESLVQQGHAVWSGITDQLSVTSHSSTSSQCSEKIVFIPG